MYRRVDDDDDRTSPSRGHQSINDERNTLDSTLPINNNKNWFAVFETKTFQLLKIIFILIIIQVGFGSYAVVLKAGAQSNGVDALVFSLFRDMACFPILLIAAVVIEGFHPPKLAHLPLFFAMGLTGMFGNQVLFIYGLYFTSPTIASIFQPLIPVLTTALALITRIEKFQSSDFRNWAKIWGICTSVGGAIVMVMAKGGFSTDSSSFIGYMLLLGNTTSMAIYVLLQKKYLYVQSKEVGTYHTLYPPITASAYSYAMGALLMGIASIPYGIVKPEVFTHLSVGVLLPLSYAVLISSALCYGLISYTASLTSATIVTSFWPLQVPVATVESYFVFGEIPGWEQYIGALFIVMGLITVCWAKYSQEMEEKKRYRASEKLQTESDDERD